MLHGNPLPHSCFLTLDSLRRLVTAFSTFDNGNLLFFLSLGT
jgi:hypothetical protein